MSDKSDFINAAIREKREREKGCEYCNGGREICENNKAELGIELHSAKSKLVAYAKDCNGWDISLTCKINFCPMCGRELKPKEERA